MAEKKPRGKRWQWYHAKKDAGICTYYPCKERSLPNRVRCAEHAKIQSRYAKKIHDQRKAEGRCLYCKVILLIPGQLCEACRLKHAAQQRLRNKRDYERRRAKGICVKCGQPLFPETDAGKATCLNCRMGESYAHRRWGEKRNH